MWQLIMSRSVISGALVFLLGLFFAATAGSLVPLGGSRYYRIGATLTVSVPR